MRFGPGGRVRGRWEEWGMEFQTASMMGMAPIELFAIAVIVIVLVALFIGRRGA